MGEGVLGVEWLRRVLGVEGVRGHLGVEGVMGIGGGGVEGLWGWRG